MAYKVKIDIFEGPFDLLVYLIENAEMNIYDIQVAEITGQYLAYVERMQEADVNVATEFMVLAAALIEIKSKMLLPRSAPIEEGIVEEDPRTELVEKILEYKKFKAAAELLENHENEKLLCFEKPKEDMDQYTNQVDEYLSLDIRQFVSAFNLFLRKKQRIEEVRKHYTRVERQKQSIEMKVQFIVGFFKKHSLKKILFKELINKESDKYDVVLTFTSMLQMIRDKLISVEQHRAFGDMEIKMVPPVKEDSVAIGEWDDN
ncbi:segregation and condensation protein A [Aminipila terrae]|uniref:Segregation and condensation protein A n=1 Tax=Aminipila terrae TaxID=2697030 RepID=A0A6P1MIM4_9FIRM|nr:segregation/condensation protein A [Aminipila terrae]QHI72464.1 segregation/condensation protein A [Aminipila terrae]